MKLSQAFLLAACATAPLQAQRILGTAAGGDAYFQGGSKPAVNASLGRMTSVALDPSGRPVFADPFFHLVMRVESDGTLTVIAGNNIQGLTGIKAGAASLFGQSGGGFSGDGGDPTLAALNRPHGVAFDAAGNLYIADSGNNRIRKVDLRNKSITTFAGSGQIGFSGDGGDPAKAALNYPISVAADPAGNVYINDAGNFRIRKVTPNGNIRTIAGTGRQGDSPDGPNAAALPIDAVEGIAADAAGNLYLAEAVGNKIREVTVDGRLVTVAGSGAANYSGDGGPPLKAALNGPAGVAVDGNNIVYISDTNNQYIRRVANSVITTIAGNGNNAFQGDGGPALNAALWNPFGLAVALTGEVYIADRDNSRIREIDAQGNLSTIAGDGQLLAAGNGAAALQVPLFDPFGVALDSSGNLIVTDTDNSVIRRGSPGGSLQIVAGNGASEYDADHASALATGLSNPASAAPDGDGFLISDTGNFVIRRFTVGGSMDIVAGNQTPGPGAENVSALQSGVMPLQTVSDAQGNIYVADFANNRIRKFRRNGSISTIQFGAGLKGVAGLALDAQGNLYASGFSSGMVVKFPGGTGTGVVIAGGGHVTGASIEGASGPNVQLLGPAGLVVDSSQNIYVADAPAHRVYQITAGGVVHIVAGNGAPGYSGDGGLATSGSLNFPWGLALDSQSNTLYIADSQNNRVRTASPVAATFAASSDTLSFAVKANGPLSDLTSLDLVPSASGLLYSVAASSPALQITPSSGVMPARLQVQVDPSTLAAGTTQQTITITASGANPPTRTVSVNITVAPEAAPSLSLGVGALQLTFVQGDSPTSKQVPVINSGGGQLCYAATTAGGSPWLGAVASGCVTANQPGSLALNIDPSQLDPGTYSDSIAIDAGAAGTASIPVNIAVNPSLARLALTENGLSFSMVEGGGVPLPKTVGIINTGQGSMPWHVNKSTDLGLSQDWLLISGSTDGTVQQPLTDSGTLRLAIDPGAASQLTAAGGPYYGRVEVRVPGNPTQTVTVVLNLLPAGTKLPPDISSEDLIFSFAGAPGQNPGAQIVTLANVEAQPLTYTSSRITTDGQNWLIHTPTSGTIQPGEAFRIVVQPDYTNLSAGNSYSGKISLQFSDGSSRSIQVTALVGSAQPVGGKLKSHATCSDSYNLMYTAASQAPVPVVTGLPTNLEVALIDACKNLISASSGNNNVTVSFISAAQETSPQNLVNNPLTAKWVRSWPPKSQPPTRVQAHFLATVLATNAVFKHAVLDVYFDVQSGSNAPVVQNGQILNGASFLPGAPVAPGSYITLKGSHLGGGGSSITPGSNLPLQLDGTQVKLGDRFLPLRYAADGQINAQIPYDVNVNDTFEVSVVYNSAISTADSIVVAKAQPGIFTADASGSGQGAIQNQAGQITDQSAPAAAGDVVNILCTGLGAVQDPIVDGVVAAKSSLTVETVTVTIGGQPAQVMSSYLAAGEVGGYVVQAVVPQSLTPGPAVPVVVSAAGRFSQTVTMAVR